MCLKITPNEKQCSKNGRFAGIWAGAAKRIPEPFSEYSEGNLKFKSREAAFLGPFWLGMSEVQSKNFTHTTHKERKAVRYWIASS